MLCKECIVLPCLIALGFCFGQDLSINLFLFSIHSTTPNNSLDLQLNVTMGTWDASGAYGRKGGGGEGNISLFSFPCARKIINDHTPCVFWENNHFL